MLQRLIPCLLLIGLLAAALPAQKIPAREVYNQFQQAVEADDYLKQKNLVTENKAHVQSVYDAFEFSWCSALGRGDQEAAAGLLKSMDAFAYVNKLENNDGYWVRRLTWAKALTPEQRLARVNGGQAFNKAYDAYQAAKKSKGAKEKVDLAMAEFATTAKFFEEATDLFWLYNSRYYQGELQSMVPNYFDAVYYYSLAQKAVADGKLDQFSGGLGGRMSEIASVGRIKPDLIDVALPLEEARTKYTEAAAAAPAAGEGAAGGGAGGTGMAELPKDAPPLPTKHDEPLEWVDAKPFKKKAFPKGIGVPTPYMPDISHWFFWPAVVIPEGGEQQLNFLPGDVKVSNDSGKIFVKRPGKKRDVVERLKLGAKPKLHSFKKVQYLDGSTSAVYHVLMTTPNRYTFNGFTLGSSGKDVAMKFRGATGVVGKLRGQDVTLFDSTGNGTFNTDQDFGRDSIIVGKGRSRTVQPLSSVVNLGGKLYHLKMEIASGEKIITKPYDDPVALLKVEYVSKRRPEFLIAQGLNNVYIDLTQAMEKPMWVPKGPYALVGGYMLEGKGDRARTLQIAGGSGQFQVGEGQLNVWKLGGAGDGFYFEVKSSVVKDHGQPYVVIKGEDVRILGNFGEEYRYSMFGVPTPKVWMRQGTDGPTWLNGEKLRKPERSELDQTVYGMFYPKPFKVKQAAPGDFSIRMEGSFEPLGKIATKGWVAGGN